MKGTYRPFTRQAHPSVKIAKITIQAGGTISLNAVAFKALHYPHLVQPSFDEALRVIQIAAARVKDAHTIPMRKEGKGRTHVFAGRSFLHQFGIDTSMARQYDAVVEQGKLYVDLKQEPRPVGKRKKATKLADLPIVSLSESQPLEPDQSMETSENSALAEEQPLSLAPATPNLEGLMEALLPVVEW